MTDKCTYREMLTQALEMHGEDFDHIQVLQVEPNDYAAPKGATAESEMDRKVDRGYGSVEGPSILAYTKDWIYFCLEYDGSEWISSLPRNPVPGFKPQHYGG